METKINKYVKALKMCCGLEKYRKWMNKPFRIDNYTYATDPHTLLRVPNSLLYTHYDELPPRGFRQERDIILKIFKAEECPYTFTQQSLRDLLNSLPQEDEYEPREECPECEGVGELDCRHCGSTYQCDKCGGEGFIDKRKLTGRKKPENTPVKIDKHVFQSDKLLKILDIAETLEYMGDIGFNPNGKTPIFNLGKCDLVIMPSLVIMPTLEEHVVEEHVVELNIESLRKI